MEESEEIRRVIERWTMASAAGDADSVLGRLSEHAGTVMIGMMGPDPAKLWRGSESRAMWAKQLEALGPFPVVATEIQAWEEGSVGWAVVRESIDWEGQAVRHDGALRSPRRQPRPWWRGARLERSPRACSWIDPRCHLP